MYLFQQWAMCDYKFHISGSLEIRLGKNDGMCANYGIMSDNNDGRYHIGVVINLVALQVLLG
jgi:hypothetical protein